MQDALRLDGGCNGEEHAQGGGGGGGDNDDDELADLDEYISKLDAGGSRTALVYEVPRDGKGLKDAQGLRLLNAMSSAITGASHYALHHCR